MFIFSNPPLLSPGTVDEANQVQIWRAANKRDGHTGTGKHGIPQGIKKCLLFKKDSDKKNMKEKYYSQSLHTPKASNEMWPWDDADLSVNSWLGLWLIITNATSCLFKKIFFSLNSWKWKMKIQLTCSSNRQEATTKHVPAPPPSPSHLTL